MLGIMRSQSSSAPSAVAVLGIGRMGTAIAARLAERVPVVTWSRSGSSVPGVESTATPGGAVKDVATVMLALFDAAACRDVLTECLQDMSADAIVVNTSTTGPDEARALADLVQQTGRRYLHAPVIGSVPQVRAGNLTILVGGPTDHHPHEVLEALGTPIVVGAPEDAAALKLVANGVLADCLLAIRQALRRVDALGQGRDAALTVLEQTPLSGLVAAKRGRLGAATHPRGGAQFTIGALAKDLALLGRATGAAPDATAVIDELTTRGSLRADDDIADLCTVAAPITGSRHEFADAHLAVAPGVSVASEVLSPLHAYAMGHATGFAEHFRDAFLPTAHIEGIRDGEFVSWDLDTYCALFDGPAPDEQRRRRVIESVTVSGSIANATMRLQHGADTFIDMFVLVRADHGWRIANKVYHREPRVQTPSTEPAVVT